ncbi:glycosyltransferase family 2 protein [Sandaracinus amylolyticus]|uniref:glycosyltransferase family 2 protein n=1 Tax=Sandaracinus amylolyticus TaxID=927083 RepID=UPI0009462C38|nr:glycosyltransferase family 2 protein [Sandaracinus amylolyticus]
MPSSEPVLSVVIPCYNERGTIHSCLERVLRSPVESIEVVVVDDGSTDGTRDLLTRGPALDPRVRVVLHAQNGGKGAALRTGFQEARGRFVLIQDADLEYDPNEYPKLLQPLLEDRADVVFGSRFAGGGSHRVLYYWHSVANHMLTTLSNMLTDLNLTDMETCYKVFRREVLQQLTLEENRFGIEPELTAKVAGLGVRVYEVPISYHGRTYAEGKKIGLKDAFRAVYCIVRYGVPARISAAEVARSQAAAARDAERDDARSTAERAEAARRN